MRSRRYGEPRVRLTNDPKWSIRLDCGELGSFELRANEAEVLATELTEAIRQLGYRSRTNNTRKSNNPPWN